MSRTAGSGGPPAAAAGTGRLAFVDVLRVLIISMVIIHHAAQAYGETGGFWPVEDQATSDWFVPFYTVNAAVGLGLLFLVAGYFLPGSYERKGPRRFLRERWVRIGVPLVFFVVAVNVPLAYLASGSPAPGEFVRSLYDGAWQGAYLHLWFLAHLLLYSAAYVLLAGRIRRLRPAAPGGPRRTLPPPGHRAILAFAAALVLVTWVVRWWFPVDDWVPLFFVIPAEPANLAQYVSLFVLGILAYRNDWFRRIPRHIGFTWLAVGLIASAAIFSLQAFHLWNVATATGGLDGRSLVRVFLETMVCAGLSVGLVVTSRELFHRPVRLLAAMAAASYAAYILHIFVVVGLQVAILQANWPAGAKFLLVAVLGVVVSFGLGHISRSVPGLRILLGTVPERRRAV
ncbi:MULTISPECIES: acyltransferase family protein [unclassified Arthrobacter]|uniref:acyltransferase family protein n=1 Tax=unclassified Arthrobacter TaxID=235627 RepID=UPI00148681D2|nr:MULTISPECIES: acyltransferase family protein [unclassified Arthrobacter]